MIYGNVDGVRNSILNELEDLYDVRIDKDSFASLELIDTMVKVTGILEREISVAIDRKGRIISVAVGDSTTVEVPLIDIKEKKLSGVRIIHTHPNGSSKLSALDNSALLKLKLDAIVALGVEEDKLNDITLGFCEVDNNVLVGSHTKPITLEEAMAINILDKISHCEEMIKLNKVEEDNTEKAILVGCDTEESLVELEELAKACNTPVLCHVFQNRYKIDSAFYIGSGKVEEIAMLAQAYRANVVIFDDELSGSQVRNLEEAIGIKVIDRTTLILDIFATRAKSRESKIQVELAQLKYRQSRLGGLGTILSRTGGGIGTKGPGEKKLEIDRRRIRERIYDLTNELKKIKKVREVQRENRTKQQVMQVALVGYTNAGKSTLRNTLCDIAAAKDMMQKDKVFEADMLFATLDVTTRAITLPDNRGITLTDTVGFVRKLPHELVEAFKSTLEEVIYADLLLHVVDASSDEALKQIEAVEEVLQELGARDKEQILVLNKIDRKNEEEIKLIKEKVNEYTIIEISAKERINLDILMNIISEKLPYTLKQAEYIIPYTDQQIVAYMHRNANIMEEDYRDNGTYVKAEVDDEVYNKCIEFLI
ncbi:GTPase HflX [Clostridium frigidicarnis]|uniref:GTPase HflX n=1 Tax=Clostridium frigidicarnis TaxID=84698 RepID=A0A1I0VLQ7_9CLOT|nr:GTPase HflX [Clostridium frigidicarnis]SFA76516.1 GTP-binding protein HflX [Clostridium frigidicarnis]